MAAMEKNTILFLIQIMLPNYIGQSDAYRFRFTQNRVSHFPLTQGRANPQEVVGYPFRSTKQVWLLCHYAKMEAKLPYIDYDYFPEWVKSEYLTYTTYCATLPTIYLLKKDHDRDIQITFIDSPADKYKFDVKVIEEAKTAIPTTNEIESTTLTNLTHEDRRNLCVAARKHSRTNAIFLTRSVPDGLMYEFDFISEQKEVYFALACPTSPKLYLRDGDSENHLKLILVRRSIDNFKFEIEKAQPESVSPLPVPHSWEYDGLLEYEERLALCARVREFTSLPVKDSNIPKAQPYSFQYAGNENETKDIALVCPMIPKVYLHLEDLMENNVKLTFVRNSFESRSFKTEFHSLSVTKTYINDKGTRRIREHSFSSLSEEDRWHFCSAAKKHVPRDIRVAVIPNHIGLPQMTRFIYSNKQSPDRLIISIECSAEPTMFIFVPEETHDADREQVMISLHERTA